MRVRGNNLPIKTPGIDLLIDNFIDTLFTPSTSPAITASEIISYLSTDGYYLRIAITKIQSVANNKSHSAVNPSWLQGLDTAQRQD